MKFSGHWPNLRRRDRRHLQQPPPARGEKAMAGCAADGGGLRGEKQQRLYQRLHRSTGQEPKVFPAAAAAPRRRGGWSAGSSGVLKYLGIDPEPGLIRDYDVLAGCSTSATKEVACRYVRQGCIISLVVQCWGGGTTRKGTVSVKESQR